VPTLADVTAAYGVAVIVRQDDAAVVEAFLTPRPGSLSLAASEAADA